MLKVTHTVYGEDGGELLCLHEAEDGSFIFDPAWEGGEVWMVFERSKSGVWHVTTEEAIPSGREEEDESDPFIVTIGAFETIDDAVRHYWKNILGC